jgi:hypothetical protein
MVKTGMRPAENARNPLGCLIRVHQSLSVVATAWAVEEYGGVKNRLFLNIYA